MAAVLLIIMGATLLTDEAAQVMAAWTFMGMYYRVVAVTGFVLSTLLPIVLYGWIIYNKMSLVRLAKGRPAADETHPYTYLS